MMPICPQSFYNPVLPDESERKQIYRNAMHQELAEMREARRVHATDTLKDRVAAARAITSETRCVSVVTRKFHVGP